MADDTDSAGNSGGLMSSLGGLMRLADPQLLISVGAGLMSGARYGSNAGEGLMQGLQMYHSMKTSELQNQLQRQQLQEGQLGLQRQQVITDAIRQAAQQGQGAGPSAGLMGSSAPNVSQQPAAAPFLPGISSMPAQGGQAPPQAAPQGLPSGLLPPSMDQLYGMTYPGGMNPNLTRALSLGSQDPGTALLKAREDQLKLAQQNYAPFMARIDQLAKSDTPTKYLNGSTYADIKAAWPQIAERYGLDPQKDYTDAGVRQALNGLRNEWAAGLQEPTEAPPNVLQNSTDAEGRTVQTDPLTGKRTVEAPGPVEKVIGPNGQPTIVPTGKSYGMTPFNPTIFGAGNVSDQSREMAYQYYLQHQALPPGFSRSPAMNADMMNYIAQRAQQEGNSQVSILANKQQLQAGQSVVKDFTSGKTAQTLNGLNTSIQHMAALEPVIDAMNNGNLTILNKAANFFKQQTGSPAPTNFAALKEFVSGEVAKAVLPGGGGEAERRALAEPISAANSPAQLKQAVETYKTALAGKTEALRNQWDVGTRGANGDFNQFLLPETKKALGISQQSATGQTLPTLTPEQARAAPKGTRFQTTDGRVMVRQ